MEIPIVLISQELKTTACEGLDVVCSHPFETSALSNHFITEAST
ncbi:hypothetical protein HNO89_001623 [Sporosarcina luteola]|nr:hypothetical protein [Sporosarcina luteola]